MLLKNNINNILKKAESYLDTCEGITKVAFIRKLPNGKYRVLSEKGKNLGTFPNKSKAEKRLKQIEYFKYLAEHKDENKAQDSSEDKVIDLTGMSDFSYSSLMRELRQHGTKDQVRDFLKLYKNLFDESIRKKLQKPDRVALQNSLITFNKIHKVKIKKKLVKNAAVSEIGDAVSVGRYLANIVKFTLGRISAEKRPGSINNLKRKFMALNERELASKKMPASSAIGQSITFVKTVLFNHDAKYIREVINNLVRFL